MQAEICLQSETDIFNEHMASSTTQCPRLSVGPVHTSNQQYNSMNYITYYPLCEAQIFVEQNSFELYT